MTRCAGEGGGRGFGPHPVSHWPGSAPARLKAGRRGKGVLSRDPPTRRPQPTGLGSYSPTPPPHAGPGQARHCSVTWGREGLSPRTCCALYSSSPGGGGRSKLRQEGWLDRPALRERVSVALSPSFTPRCPVERIQPLYLARGDLRERERRFPASVVAPRIPEMFQDFEAVVKVNHASRADPRVPNVEPELGPHSMLGPGMGH